MKLLLDTHVLLWWLADDRKLPAAERALIADPDNDIFVSAASVWEIAIKKGLGRIEIDLADLQRAIIESGFIALPVNVAHAAAIASLKPVHGDPFDRILIAQCIEEGLRTVTHDIAFSRYASQPNFLAPIVF